MEIELLKYPFPYHCMLAICSDLDETPSAHEYFEISRYLNTPQKTQLGDGINLEVANTLYFDMPNNQFAYWNTTDAARSQTRDLIKSGHIDSFHSFGDLALNRSDARRSLEELEKHGCRMPIWVDHATAVTNLGTDIMQGDGARVGTDAYHLDLLKTHGVRYVWTGRVTSTLGQNSNYNPWHLLNRDHFSASAKTTLKELLKYILSYAGSSKYRLHRRNRLFAETTLADGSKWLEFMRCNPNSRGVNVGEHSQGVAESINRRNLEILSRRQGACILYTHLGKHLQGERLFPEQTRRAFTVLADAVAEQKVLVATTSRLLNYVESHAHASTCWQAEHEHVTISLPQGLNANGLTFRTKAATALKIRVNGVELENLRHAPHPDGGYCTWVDWPNLTHAEA